MTLRDRRIFVTGLILFLLSCLYLPMEVTWGDQSVWLQRGWYWITKLGRFGVGDQYRVDTSRLFLEWLAIGAIMAILRLILPGRKS